MAKTITREEFKEAVSVCRRIFRAAQPSAGKDIAEFCDTLLEGWTEGLEQYLFDDDPLKAEEAAP